MARMVSFIVLIVILVLMGFLFFRLMAQFFVPVFLAVVLVVIFRPLHAWLQAKLRGRVRIAAALTTVIILLIVLLPLTFLTFRGIAEGVAIANGFDADAPNVFLKKIENAYNPFRDRLADYHLEISTFDELKAIAIQHAKEFLAPVALGGAQFLLGFLFGSTVMIISTYYFFADGPAMIDAAMKLSPLDDKQERELLEQFDKVSRAVVVATLLSAIAQGFLAGFGYYFVGLNGVFLLVGLTTLFAMVPFVGAAAVWVPCCAWLFLVDGRVGAAIGLAIYGVVVISMVDNVIKPFILHGQSNLHPLLALLSVLGGVTALGPIGILVGPMVVSFLQALLNMLRIELDSMTIKSAP